MNISGIRTQIKIGSTQILRCPSCVIESERYQPLSRATLTLADASGELYRTFARGDSVQIEVGYRNQPPSIWSGSVRWIGKGETKDQICIGAVDSAMPLLTTRLKQVWENETPEAIVAYAIRLAGFKVGRVGQVGMILPRVIASDISVWQLVQQIAISCHQSFAIDMSRWALWLGSDGVNWGDFDEPGAVPVIATGAGLLTHEPAVGVFGRGRIVTLLQPGLMHSRRVQLKDSRRGIDSRHRVLSCEQLIEPNKMRTHIEYGVEHGRF